jgi:hypothetical protein
MFELSLLSFAAFALLVLFFLRLKQLQGQNAVVWLLAIGAPCILLGSYLFTPKPSCRQDASCIFSDIQSLFCILPRC